MVALSHATARELGYAPPPTRRQAVRRGVGPQGPRRQGRRPARSPVDKAPAEVRKRNPELAGDADARGTAEADRRRRRPLLPGQVLARQDHRLRHRRGPELRGRDGPVPAVRGRARRQHLRQAAASGSRSDEAAVRAGDRRRCRPTRSTSGEDADELWDLVLEAARLDEIVEPAVRTLELVGARQVRLRPGAGVQRVLSPLPDPERGARRRAAVARGRRQLLHAADDTGARPDGRVVPGRM